MHLDGFIGEGRGLTTFPWMFAESISMRQDARPIPNPCWQ